MTALLIGDDDRLNSCAREPIHIPGSVQPRGVLFACADGGWTVSHVSANADILFGLSAREVIGQPLQDIVGLSLHGRLTRLLSADPAKKPGAGRMFGVTLPKGDLVNVSVHSHAGRCIIEIEPVTAAFADAPLDAVRTMLPSLQQARTLAGLCNVAASQMRSLIGYDRVMIYRFLPDGSGQVIAEDREERIEPYLNLRYPASDIPPPARELYKKNWVRLISDVDARQVPIWSDEGPGSKPLDLSLADLRSVSPVHIEYLRNMGVGASMSISIIVGGELWGLIACHNETARDVPANLRSAAELLGQVFSLQLQSVEGVEAYVTLRGARAFLDQLVSEFPVGSGISDLNDHIGQLAALVPCDGAGLWIDGSWNSVGLAADAGEAEALSRSLGNGHETGVFATHRLVEAHPHATFWRSGLKGVMAVPISLRGDWLFLFRQEVARSVKWGGNPDKTAAVDPATGRLHPRKSFAAWTEMVRGQSQPFTSRERLIGETLRLYLRDIIVRYADASAEQKCEADLRQRLLTGEHTARVRATLDLIRSLVDPASEADGAVRTYVQALDQRLRSVSLAHEAASSPSGPGLADLVEQTLGQTSSIGRIAGISGSNIRLDSRAYTVLAVVLNELVSLSSACGALASENGRLAVRWMLDNAGAVVIEWVEEGAGGNAASAHAFGLSLARRSIPQMLGGDSDVGFAQGGLHARLVIPHRYVRAGHGMAETVALRQSEKVPRALEGFAILLVDEDAAAGDQFELQMRRRGASTVMRAPSAAAALELMAGEQPDVAVLNIDPGSGSSFPIADILSAQGVPFVFSGVGDRRDTVPPRYADVMVVRKPYCGDAIAALLQEVLLPHMIRAVLGGGEPGQPGS